MNIKKILLAEDEVLINNTIKKYLEIKLNYKVYSVFDGEEAIKVFNEEQIDIVLLDIMMPKKNGFEVLNIIRETSMVPVIILTALDIKKVKIDSKILGVNAYITKPFSPKDLVFEIERLLELPIDTKGNTSGFKL